MGVSIISCREAQAPLFLFPVLGGVEQGACCRPFEVDKGVQIFIFRGAAGVARTVGATIPMLREGPVEGCPSG